MKVELVDLVGAIKEDAEGQSNNQTFYSALDLYQYDIQKVPKLVDPLFQQVGLVSLAGTSDVGKSTILRQLALSVALKSKNWLGFPLNIKHGRSIYVSTEDDKYSVSIAIKKQLKKLSYQHQTQSALLQNISFLFETENLFKTLEIHLEKQAVDLIVIDAFTDVFDKEINSSTQVRAFLQKYHLLASKHECLIIFLHHTGKRTQYKRASKDNLLGSQAFEAKMRCVLELKSDQKDKELRHLCILKSNYLPYKEKSSTYVLKFDEEHLFFTNTKKRAYIDNLNAKASKFDNKEELKTEAIKLHKAGKSLRDIENLLKKRFKKSPSKSTLSNWFKKLDSSD